MEKRSQGDGTDVGELLKGMRRVRMSGTLFAASRALLYDAFFELRAALDPVLSQADSPADFGYQPMYFSVPTANTDSTVVANSQSKLVGYPGGRKYMQILTLPRAFQAILQRDMLGDKDRDAGYPFAIPWHGTFICRDPRIMGETPQLYTINSAPAVLGGTLVNRGNYLSPLNMVFETNATAGLLVVHIGNTIINITVPSSSGNRIFRYKGDERVLTVEENGLEVPRMDLLTGSQVDLWALVPPGITTPWSITLTGTTLQSGSEFHYYETFA
jgi:hypothetical protein